VLHVQLLSWLEFTCEVALIGHGTHALSCRYVPALHTHACSKGIKPALHRQSVTFVDPALDVENDVQAVHTALVPTLVK